MRIFLPCLLLSANLPLLTAYLDIATPEKLKTFNKSSNPLDVQLRLLTVMNLMQQEWHLFSGYWYKLFEIELMWIPAENFCREMGGHLVSIKDMIENDFVHQLRKIHLLSQWYLGRKANFICEKEMINSESLENNIWIGLNKVRQHKGPYEWSDGLQINYLNWDSSQPNEPEVDCVYMAYAQEKRGTWFDYSCHGKLPQYFVCKLFLG